jgi:hypothetical protein
MTRDEVVELVDEASNDLGLKVIGSLTTGQLGEVDLKSRPMSTLYDRVYLSGSEPSRADLSVGVDRPHSVGWVQFVVPNQTERELSMCNIAYKTDDPENPAHKLFAAVRRRVLKNVKFGGFTTSASTGGRWPLRNVGFSVGATAAYADGIHLVQYLGDRVRYIPPEANVPAEDDVTPSRSQ